MYYTYICIRIYTTFPRASSAHTQVQINTYIHIYIHIYDVKYIFKYMDIHVYNCFHANRLDPKPHRDITPKLQRVAVCCSVLQCVAVCCSVLQHVAACCSVLQCVARVAMRCNGLRFVAVWSLTCTKNRTVSLHPNSSVLQCIAVCCSVLQCVAVCCSVLQYVSVCCSASIPRI